MFNKQIRFTTIATFSLLLFFVFASADLALAQTDEENTTEEPRIPAPQALALVSRDGVKIWATYFAAPQTPGEDNAEGADVPANGKTTIPYLVLHDWGSSQKDVRDFAIYLQSQGNAVLTADLRGHGESVSMAEGLGNDLKKPLDHNDFRSSEIASVTADIERCKKELVRLNNEGELNIDMLTVVAIGKTTPIVTQWVIDDWYKFPPYSSSGVKQGQDVKLLVLVAPVKKHGPFRMSQLVGHNLFTSDTALPTVVAWGTASEKAKDANWVYAKMEKGRSGDKELKKNQRSLIAAKFATSAPGKKLMSDTRMAGFWRGVHQLAVQRIGKQAEALPWQNRQTKKEK